jgi:2-amino-4-hydroxy-6-hydroxymethyldihydropteridine diphosphokinase
MKLQTVYIGLGSNLSPRVFHLKKGISGLTQNGIKIQAISSVYLSSPVGYRDQPNFLNAVVKGRTNLSPHHLIQALLKIEKENGRVRNLKGRERTLDLDLLLYNSMCMQTSDLILPHPRITERKFVLIPLLEIEPNLASPEGESYQKALLNLSFEQEYHAQTVKCYRHSWVKQNC